MVFLQIAGAVTPRCRAAGPRGAPCARGDVGACGGLATRVVVLGELGAVTVGGGRPSVCTQAIVAEKGSWRDAGDGRGLDWGFGG